MFTVQPDMSENVQQYLNEIDLWHWNPFRLNHLTGNRCLHFTMMKLWQRYNFSQRFKIAPQVLMAYCDILEEHYQIVSVNTTLVTSQILATRYVRDIFVVGDAAFVVEIVLLT